MASAYWRILKSEKLGFAAVDHIYSIGLLDLVADALRRRSVIDVL